MDRPRKGDGQDNGDDAMTPVPRLPAGETPRKPGRRYRESWRVDPKRRNAGWMAGPATVNPGLTMPALVQPSRQRSTGLPSCLGHREPHGGVHPRRTTPREHVYVQYLQSGTSSTMLGAHDPTIPQHPNLGYHGKHMLFQYWSRSEAAKVFFPSCSGPDSLNNSSPTLEETAQQNISRQGLWNLTSISRN